MAVLGVNPRLAQSRRFVEHALERDEPVAALAIWPIGATAESGLDFIALARNSWLNEIACRFGVPLNVHVGAGNEERIGRVTSLGRYCPEHAIEWAMACPDIRFNLSHALRLSQTALRAAATLPNVFTDLSGLSCHQRWSEAGEQIFPAADAGELALMPARELVTVLVRDFGLGSRAMYGSSYPFGLWWDADLASELRLVCDATLAPHEEAALLHANAEHFFRPAPAPVAA